MQNGEKRAANNANRFLIGGDIEIHRIGFGAMRITGEGIWGEPANRAEALRTLRRLPELGVNFIDTADSYGPEVSENLIREALHPFQRMLIATKGGMARLGPGKYTPVGTPEYLRQCVLMSLRRLRVDRIDLWHLHRIDPKVPREEQFDAIREMQSEGLIRHVGLSAVNIDDIERAHKFVRVPTVQKLYNLANSDSKAVLDYCEVNAIGFISFSPLAGGQLLGCVSRLAGDRCQKRGDAETNCTSVDAKAKSSHATDSRNGQRKTSGRECCSSLHKTLRGRFSGTRRRRHEGVAALGQIGSKIPRNGSRQANLLMRDKIGTGRNRGLISAEAIRLFFKRKVSGRAIAPE